MLKNLVDAANELPAPIVTLDTLAEYKVPPYLAQKMRDNLKLHGLNIDAHTSSLKTSETTTETNFAVFPNQYFSFACHFYEFANELIEYFKLLAKFQDKCTSSNLDAAEILYGNWAEIKTKIQSKPVLSECFENDAEIDLFCKFLDQEDKTYRLGSKSPVNNNKGFSIRGYEDCFGSVILTRINLPNASSSIFGELVYALTRKPEIFLELKTHHNHFVEQLSTKHVGMPFQQLIYTQLPKPFLLLAGISGTGKTRFVREQAIAHCGGDLSNHRLIPVRPDWHEPSDLLGYISRIGQDGPRYVVTDLLRFVVQAWKDAAASVTVAGLVCKSPADMTPYWLCLDEMNLAPVEQYFADYLAVLETRKWEDGNYSCDPLLTTATIQQLDEAGLAELRKQLELDEEHDGLWQHFLGNGIALPPNLIVAGTVNMDETTHGFSRKVIDRAFTIDFGEFYPNEFAEYFGPSIRAKVLGFPVQSHVRESSDLQNVAADPDGSRSIAFLRAINTVLKSSPFELAFRALNELLLAVICFKPKDDAELQAVWDDFLMSKVLPRIDGDAEKLSANAEASLLTRLRDEIDKQFTIIGTAPRPDLLREKIDGSVCPVDCRAKQKLAWMQTRLDANGFTAFWP